jgi:hypothetical protein
MPCFPARIEFGSISQNRAFSVKMCVCPCQVTRRFLRHFCIAALEHRSPRRSAIAWPSLFTRSHYRNRKGPATTTAETTVAKHPRGGHRLNRGSIPALRTIPRASAWRPRYFRPLHRLSPCYCRPRRCTGNQRTRTIREHLHVESVAGKQEFCLCLRTGRVNRETR